MVHFGKYIVAEAEVVHDFRAEVLDDDVGPGGQAEEELSALRLREIERAAVLVAVCLVEVWGLVPDALSVCRLAGEGAKDIPVVDALDLDHFGAHIGEQAGGVGPGP